MEITKIWDEKTITLKLDGWLDTISAPELGKAIDEIESADSIILDFDNVEYIASSGLRQVVASYKRAKSINAKFSLINVSSELMNIFTLTGLQKKIEIQVK